MRDREAAVGVANREEDEAEEDEDEGVAGMFKMPPPLPMLEYALAVLRLVVAPGV